MLARWLAARPLHALLLGFCVFRVDLSATGQQEVSPCQSAANFLAGGRLQEALEQYGACVKEAPHLNDVMGLAETCFRLGRYAEAIDAYQRAAALKPDDPDIYTQLGLVFIKAHRYQDAVPKLGRAVILQPGNHPARNLLAMALFQLKEYELAAIEAGQVRKAEPSNISATFILGSSYLQMRLYKHAIPLLKAALAATGSPEIRTTLGKAYLGNHEDTLALHEFAAVERVNPQIPGLYSEIGAAYADLGQKEPALKAYQKALEIDADDFGANYYLARMSWVQGDYEAAAKYLAQASRVSPDDPLVQLQSAELAAHDQDYAEAERLLQKVAQQLPDEIRAHVLLSQVYLRLQKVDESQKEQAIANALQKIAAARREKALGIAAEKSQSARGHPSSKSLPSGSSHLP